LAGNKKSKKTRKEIVAEILHRILVFGFICFLGLVIASLSFIGGNDAIGSLLCLSFWILLGIITTGYGLLKCVMEYWANKGCK